MSASQLVAECPELENFRIRINEETKQGSVLDVICGVLKCNASNASLALQRLGAEFPKLGAYGGQCTHLRINGQGRKTPVADAQTLVDIIWSLPGQRVSKFRRVCAHYICRLLAGGLTLSEEIERQHTIASPAAQQNFMHDFDFSVVGASELDRKRERLQFELLQHQAELGRIDVCERQISFLRLAQTEIFPYDEAFQSSVSDALKSTVLTAHNQRLQFPNGVLTPRQV